MEILQSDLFIEVAPGEQLHVKRIRQPQAGEAVLLLHGVMANGRIFYSASGKGLAHYLARAGFDVFIPDLRGRGASAPAINRHSRHGQGESIQLDLPAVHSEILRIKGAGPVHWLAHSWGGVLMTSCLLRYPGLIPQVGNCVYFAAKRSVRVMNWQRRLQIDLVWNHAAGVIVRLIGFFPARRLGLGIDNESARSQRQCNRWAQGHPWVDEDDGFDYGAAAARVGLPPILYLAAAADACLGHPEDVRRFCAESGPARSCLHLLARTSGHLHDYDHASLLTHADAPRDHFPLVLRWLRGQYQAVSENY
jgi:predicted alpha/beta hydrolase